MYPYSKVLRLKKSSSLLWNVLEKILDAKKYSPPDELKKGGKPCNCRELDIIMIFVVLSLHGNQDIIEINI